MAVVLLAVLAGVRILVAEPIRIPSDSMAPTLRAGDHVLLLRPARPVRGGLVVFTEPGGSGLLIKRVAAVGGDSIGIEDGVLVVNGVPVHEPYLDLERMDSVYYGPVTLPADQLFVLGDNRGDSVDSLAFGPIPAASVEGRVIARLWPRPARFHPLSG